MENDLKGGIWETIAGFGFNGRLVRVWEVGVLQDGVGRARSLILKRRSRRTKNEERVILDGRQKANEKGEGTPRIRKR